MAIVAALAGNGTPGSGLYEQIRRQRLDAAIQARPFVDTAYQATGLPIPPAHVIAGFRAD